MEDAADIARVQVRSWQTAYQGQVPDEFLNGLSVAARTDAWATVLPELDPPGRSVLVLVDDGDEIVGFASLGPSRDDDATPETGEVMAIYLLPAVWGMGGGRQLMAASLEELRRAGFTTSSLWVLNSNARARRFYEVGGWVADGTSKDDPRDGFVFHEIRYRRTLGGTS